MIFADRSIRSGGVYVGVLKRAGGGRVVTGEGLREREQISDCAKEESMRNRRGERASERRRAISIDVILARSSDLIFDLLREPCQISP